MVEVASVLFSHVGLLRIFCSEKKNCLKTKNLLKPRHLSHVIAGRVEVSYLLQIYNYVLDITLVLDMKKDESALSSYVHCTVLLLSMYPLSLTYFRIKQNVDGNTALLGVCKAE